MSKRRASTELCDCDEKLEVADCGTPGEASPDEVKNRVIKKAERSLGKVIHYSHLVLFKYHFYL